MSRILIRMLTKALGDTLGASPYFESFRKQKEQDVYVSCQFHELFQEIYPKIKFIPFGFQNTSLFTEIFNLDFKFDVPLQKGFSDQLGLDYEEIRPRIHRKISGRKIPEKYVCIAFQSTAQSRYWNREGGWDTLFNKLRQRGLIPISVDQHASFGGDGSFNILPSSCVDKTGLPLDEVIELIEHCEFFIGLTTGLSWLAHSMGKHVVLISGSTHDWCEPVQDITRIINKSVCHGCFNEPEKTPFNPGDWNWCPHHKGTSQQFICSKSISPEMVWEQMLKGGII
jgi:autotransporter strand-loop-strand O-heptosyltransferase